MNPWHGLWRLALFITRKILFLWVKTRLLDGQVERVQAAARYPVCYVLERPGLADLAVLEEECLRHGLPPPSAGPRPNRRADHRDRGTTAPTPRGALEHLPPARLVPMRVRMRLVVLAQQVLAVVVAVGRPDHRVHVRAHRGAHAGVE